MRIVVIGGSGFVGQKVVDEALLRGHEVDSIFRTSTIEKVKNLSLHKMTIFDESEFKNILEKADCIVSAYNPGYYHVAQKDRYLDAYTLIFKLVKELKKRIIVVSGATSLIQFDGELVRNGFYPKPWLKALEGPDEIYYKYKDDADLDVTFVSPPAELIDGKRTTKYGFDKDHLVYNDNFESRISVQDLAHAILDEIENPKYRNSRFTIAYK